MPKEEFEEYMARTRGGLERMHQDYETVPCHCGGQQGKFVYYDELIDCPGWRLNAKDNGDK